MIGSATEFSQMQLSPWVLAPCRQTEASSVVWGTGCIQTTIHGKQMYRY